MHFYLQKVKQGGAKVNELIKLTEVLKKIQKKIGTVLKKRTVPISRNNATYGSNPKPNGKKPKKPGL